MEIPAGQELDRLFGEAVQAAMYADDVVTASKIVEFAKSLNVKTND